MGVAPGKTRKSVVRVILRHLAYSLANADAYYCRDCHHGGDPCHHLLLCNGY